VAVTIRYLIAKNGSNSSAHESQVAARGTSTQGHTAQLQRQDCYLAWMASLAKCPTEWLWLTCVVTWGVVGGGSRQVLCLLGYPHVSPVTKLTLSTESLQAPQSVSKEPRLAYPPGSVCQVVTALTLQSPRSLDSTPATPAPLLC
jgi:hypothetical protein